jgi:hypothetical protein
MKDFLRALFCLNRKRANDEPPPPPLPRVRHRRSLQLEVLDERMLTEAGKRATRNGVLYVDEVE